VCIIYVVDSVSEEPIVVPDAAICDDEAIVVAGAAACGVDAAKWTIVSVIAES